MKNLPDDHFLDVDDNLLEFLEKQGEDCIRDVYQSNAVNKENGQKLLSLLIVGIGSSFLLLTQKQLPVYLLVGLGIFTIYWSLCASYLVVRVLGVRQRVLASSSPYSLYHEDYKDFSDTDYAGFKAKGFTGDCSTLSILRRYRLAGLERIAAISTEENNRLGAELERVRIATILTPVCALIFSALSYLFF